MTKNRFTNVYYSLMAEYLAKKNIDVDEVE